MRHHTWLKIKNNIYATNVEKRKCSNHSRVLIPHVFGIHVCYFPFRFALKFVMIKHNQTHSKRRDFVCDICAKPFTTSTGLQTHRSQHSTEPKPRVQCNLCHLWWVCILVLINCSLTESWFKFSIFRYKNVETLRSHLRRHRDVRKHTCSQCGKVCSTRSSLASHVRYVHLRISQHSCGICQKNFRRKLELTEHMARHTGEILYRCSKCPKTFSSSSNYFSHRKARHPESLNTAKEEWNNITIFIYLE